MVSFSYQAEAVLMIAIIDLVLYLWLREGNK